MIKLIVKLSLVVAIVFQSFISTSQSIATFAGCCTSGGVLGDGGPATNAQLNDPGSGTFDKYGNYYFVDALGGNRVRKIDISGVISTVAGKGIAGFSGDSGLATNAELATPTAVKLDTVGNLYIVDQGNFRLRKVDAATGIISTIAGNGVSASLGDGGPASASSLGNPQDIAIDSIGNIYIAEWNARVRKISNSGIITTICGTGVSGYSGDGCRADTSKIGGIAGICLDKKGNIYLADESNSRIFKINVSGIISTFAGTSTGYLFNADEILATAANIDPIRIEFDKFGNLFIAEYQNYRVRMVDKNGIIHTAAGIGTAGFSGDGGPATAAQFLYPTGIAFDSCNNLYVPEANNNRIRKITYTHCNYLSVPETSKQTEQTIYPNPVATVLTITNVKDGSYLMFNAIGTEVGKGILKAGNNTINLEWLPAGIYLLEVRGENGLRMVKRVEKN